MGGGIVKKSKGYRPKKMLWEFNGDGRFDKERIKGKDKARMKKLRRLHEQKYMKIEIEEYKRDVAIGC
jgi:hypothetical protein